MAICDLIDRHRRPADGARGLQLGHAGLRRGRGQLDDGHRRDRRHRGGGAQHAPVARPPTSARAVRPTATCSSRPRIYDAMVDAAAEGRRLPRHDSREGAAAQGDVGRRRPSPRRHRRHRAAASSPKLAGFRFPADRKFIIVHGDGIGKEHHLLQREAHHPAGRLQVRRFRRRRSRWCAAIYEVGGKGHSCGIYSFDDDHIHRLALAAPVVA